MTNPAAPPTLTTPEQILTRLIAVLSGIIYALIDASLLPRAMRNHLRREFATYFADLTARLIASLTTPIPAPAAPAPHASVAVGTPTARATPRLTIPRLTIRRAAHHPTHSTRARSRRTPPPRKFHPSAHPRHPPVTRPHHPNPPQFSKNPFRAQTLPRPFRYDIKTIYKIRQAPPPWTDGRGLNPAARVRGGQAGAVMVSISPVGLVKGVVASSLIRKSSTARVRGATWRREGRIA